MRTKVAKATTAATAKRWAVFRCRGQLWYTLLSADMPLPLGTYELVEGCGCGQCELRGRLPPMPLLVACDDQ